MQEVEIRTLKVIKETVRDEQEILDPEKISYIVKEYIGKNNLKVKFTDPPLEASVTSFEENNRIRIQFPGSFKIRQNLTLFATFKKHMEFDCDILDIDANNKAEAVISTARIGTANRTAGRLYPKEEQVMADNFYISKNKIDMNPFSYSVSNRVLFHEEEKSLSAEYPGIKISDLNPTDENIISKIIRKKGKGILVPDTQNDDSYLPINENFADFHQFLGAYLEQKKKEYLEKNIRSIIGYPLRYTNLKGECFPIGFVEWKSGQKHFTLEDYQHLEALEKRIIDRIKDANTINLNVKQKILNIGLGGILLEIENKEFQNLIMNRSDMTFDVVFKMQQPLRFYGEIRHIRETPDKKLLVGISFMGTVHSEHSGITSKKRLDDNIAYLARQGAIYQNIL